MILSIILLSFCFPEQGKNIIDRPFKESGAIESLLDLNIDYDELVLVQLDLVNDSLFNIVYFSIPDLNLNVGPATYHRVFPADDFDSLTSIISTESYNVLKRPYILPTNSREYWIEVKQGSQTHGTYTEDDAISYTCDCVGGATDCVKLGWDSWYNPFDYWGEAWWAFAPPFHTEINEIRVVVRGAQCDDLPLWSETYMGMRDQNGSWSQDYELSIEYTDNMYVVPEVWSEGMLMPIIGSEDNYVVDEVTLQFFYNCSSAGAPNYVVSSDGNYCDYINVSWESPENSEGLLGYNLYRDQVLINQFDSDQFNFIDYGASDNTVHEYCVVSINECGESDQSCNTGFKKNDPGTIETVSASDGEYQDYVYVVWSASSEASLYKIYRDGVWLGVLDAEFDLEYLDYFSDFGFEHNYCIEGVNDCGESDWQCDIGYGGLGLGDINSDSYVDVLDVVMLVNIIMGFVEPTTSQIWAADINNDDQINIQDIVLLVNMILD